MIFMVQIHVYEVIILIAGVSTDFITVFIISDWLESDTKDKEKFDKSICLFDFLLS